MCCADEFNGERSGGIAKAAWADGPGHRDSQELDAPELEDADRLVVGLTHAPDPPSSDGMEVAEQNVYGFSRHGGCS